jgi:histidine ammonia-lyase
MDKDTGYIFSLSNVEDILTVAYLMCEYAEGNKTMKKREAALTRSNGEKIFKHKIQPFYSLRCVPQVLGPVWDAMEYLSKWTSSKLPLPK